MSRKRSNADLDEIAAERGPTRQRENPTTFSHPHVAPDGRFIPPEDAETCLTYIRSLNEKLLSYVESHVKNHPSTLISWLGQYEGYSLGIQDVFKNVIPTSSKSKWKEEKWGNVALLPSLDGTVKAFIVSETVHSDPPSARFLDTEGALPKGEAAETPEPPTPEILYELNAQLFSQEAGRAFTDLGAGNVTLKSHPVPQAEGEPSQNLPTRLSFCTEAGNCLLDAPLYEEMTASVVGDKVSVVLFSLVGEASTSAQEPTNGEAPAGEPKKTLFCFKTESPEKANELKGKILGLAPQKNLM